MLLNPPGFKLIKRIKTVCTFKSFLKWWCPKIFHFSRMFYFKPSILGYPHSRKPPFENGFDFFDLERRVGWIPCHRYSLLRLVKLRTSTKRCSNIHSLSKPNMNTLVIMIKPKCAIKFFFWKLMILREISTVSTRSRKPIPTPWVSSEVSGELDWHCCRIHC